MHLARHLKPSKPPVVSTSGSWCGREALPRPEVRPLNRQKGEDIRREEDESRGDRCGREGRENQDDRPEPHNGREADRPRPQLTSEDPDTRCECDDRGVPAEERMAVHEVEVGPEDRGEDRDDPRRGREHRRPRAPLGRGGDDGENRRDEPRERDDPPRRSGKLPELRGAREERDAAREEAQPDEPAEGLLGARSHTPPSGCSDIRIEPRRPLRPSPQDGDGPHRRCPCGVRGGGPYATTNINVPSARFPPGGWQSPSDRGAVRKASSGLRRCERVGPVDQRKIACFASRKSWVQIPAGPMPYYIGTSGCNQARKRRVEVAPSVHGYDRCRNANVFRGSLV